MKIIAILSLLFISGCANLKETGKKLIDPKAFTIEAESSRQVSGKLVYMLSTNKPYHGSVGRLAIVMDSSITKHLNVRYGIEHRSYIDTGDRGEERAIVGFTWKPFRR